MFASIWLFFGLPSNFNSLPFLNERELHLMNIRAKQRAQYMGPDTGFKWSYVRDALGDFKTYTSCIIQFCQDTVLYGFSTFLPAILRLGLGYSSMQAQYLSVPVYLLAGFVFLVSAFLSDRFRLRGPIFFLYNIVGAIGYILLLAVGNNAVKYFACYLITFSLYTGTGLNISWLTNNVAPHYKRATALGLNQTIGNLSGAIAGQVYTHSPYVLGNSFTLGCIVVSNILTLGQILVLRKINMKRERILNGEIPDDKTDRRGDDALDFKYCL